MNRDYNQILRNAIKEGNCLGLGGTCFLPDACKYAEKKGYKTKLKDKQLLRVLYYVDIENNVKWSISFLGLKNGKDLAVFHREVGMTTPKPEWGLPGRSIWRIVKAIELKKIKENN